MTRQELRDEFHGMLKELGELFDRKNADYGHDEDPLASVRGAERWGVAAWVGVMIRIGDKVTRLQSLAQHGDLRNESADDSLRDIAVYSLLARRLLKEAAKPKAPIETPLCSALPIPFRCLYVFPDGQMCLGVEGHKGSHASWKDQQLVGRP